MSLARTVLITGGAGFIGTHLTRALQGKAQKIVLLDNLLPQVHKQGKFGAELQQTAACVIGDVRESTAIH